MACDFKPKYERDRSDLFASTPPLEAVKLMFRKAAAGRWEGREGRMQRKKLMFIDVKKAHLCGHLKEGGQHT